MDIKSEVKNYLDEVGRLKVFPAKRKNKMKALAYMASFFEVGRTYTESEVNDIIDEHTTFHDAATVRREMYNNRFFDRSDDGKSYWLEEEQPEL